MALSQVSGALAGAGGLTSSVRETGQITASLRGSSNLGASPTGPLQVVASFVGTGNLVANPLAVHFLFSSQGNADAATPSWNVGYGGIPCGFQQLTLGASAVFLTPPPRAHLAIISVETANIRWRDDTIAPTASTGVLIVAGNPPMVYSAALNNIQFIAVSGSPVLNISYYT